jgi:hypothetical protein
MNSPERIIWKFAEIQEKQENQCPQIPELFYQIFFNCRISGKTGDFFSRAWG